MLVWGNNILKAQWCSIIHNDLEPNLPFELYEPDNSQLWQIGYSNKTILNDTHLSIMTDTLNNYPINSNASFQLKLPAGISQMLLSAQYKTNSDTLTDFCKIEISLDDGNNWFSPDSLNPDAANNPYKTIFSGNSQGTLLYYCNYPQPGIVPGLCDTIRFKFTFVSDSIETNKEGIQFWNLSMYNWWDGVEENPNNKLLTIYPNPVADKLSVYFYHPKTTPAFYQISDISGKIIREEKITADLFSISTDNITPGTYILTIFDTNNQKHSKRFVK